MGIGLFYTFETLVHKTELIPMYKASGSRPLLMALKAWPENSSLFSLQCRYLDQKCYKLDKNQQGWSK